MKFHRFTRQRVLRDPVVTLCTAAALLCGAPALTQQTAPAPQSQQPAAEFSDQKIQAFARAQNRISEIGAKWNAKLEREQKTSPDDVAKARESAHQEMVTAVVASGLSVEEYNQIALAAQNDPQLQQRIRKLSAGT